MQVIQGFDTVKPAIAGEGSPTLPAGVYVCRILNAKEETSKKGHPMLVLAVDIVGGEYDNFYATAYKNKKQWDKDAKWPCNYYQRLDGDNLSFFKGLITAIEDSNSHFRWEWNEKDLHGCKFAGVFQRQEVFFEDKGKSAMVTKLISIRSIPAMEENRIKIPEDKMLDDRNTRKQSIKEREVTEDDIPF